MNDQNPNHDQQYIEDLKDWFAEAQKRVIEAVAPAQYDQGAYLAGFRAGAEAMRDFAAVRADLFDLDCDSAGDCIRGLPLPGERIGRISIEAGANVGAVAGSAGHITIEASGKDNP